MSDIDTKKLRELAEAATQPSPWSVKRTPGGRHRTDEADQFNVLDVDGMWVAKVGPAPHDAAFIAAANPQTVIALLDEIERLRAIEDAARAYRHAWSHVRPAHTYQKTVRDELDDALGDGK
jgi:hypothetical protein